MLFEHHQGILLLLRHKIYAPAFALMRTLVEMFLRMHMAMHGTEAQLASLKNGTYQTEFANIGEKINQFYGAEPLLAPWLKENATILHGFAHGGLEQLDRRRSGTAIIANYSDTDVRDVVDFTTFFPILVSVTVTQFLGFDPECKRALEITSEYLRLHPNSGRSK